MTDPTLVTLVKDLSVSQGSPKAEAEKNTKPFSQDEVLSYTHVSERHFDGVNVKVYKLSDGRGWVHETLNKKNDDVDASPKRGLKVHGPFPTCQDPNLKCAFEIPIQLIVHPCFQLAGN